MEKPYLAEFTYLGFDPVHEAGKQPRWYGKLGDFQKGSDGVYRKVLTEELSLAQLEAAGFTDHALSKFQMASAVKALEERGAQIATLQGEANQWVADRLAATEEVRNWARMVADATDKVAKLEKHNSDISTALQDALQARDNFAALEKKTRGELIAQRKCTEIAHRGNARASDKLNKIPPWLRRLFGAI